MIAKKSTHDYEKGTLYHEKGTFDHEGHIHVIMITKKADVVTKRAHMTTNVTRDHEKGR